MTFLIQRYGSLPKTVPVGILGWVLLGLGIPGRTAENSQTLMGEGEILSHEIVFEKREGLIHNSGDVHLTIPGALVLTCEDLQAQQDANRKFSTIIATTNVVIQLLQFPDPTAPAKAVTDPSGLSMATVTNRPAETNWAYGFRAVFIGTNNTVVLTGSDETGPPRVETSSATITAEQLTYNRTTGKFIGSGKSVTRFKVGQFNLGTKRDSKTNSP